MLPFGAGDKSEAIEGLRKLAKDVDCDLSLDNLHLEDRKSLSNGDKSVKVFMGFDSPPMYSTQEWMAFQPNYKGPNTPIIDNLFNLSSAGMLLFMTSGKASHFNIWVQLTKR